MYSKPLIFYIVSIQLQRRSTDFIESPDSSIGWGESEKRDSIASLCHEFSKSNFTGQNKRNQQLCLENHSSHHMGYNVHYFPFLMMQLVKKWLTHHLDSWRRELVSVIDLCTLVWIRMVDPGHQACSGWALWSLCSTSQEINASGRGPRADADMTALDPRIFSNAPNNFHIVQFELKQCTIDAQFWTFKDWYEALQTAEQTRITRQIKS